MIKYIFLLLWASSLSAHFIIDTQSREIHVLKHKTDTTKVVLRFPLTLAYANELSKRATNEVFTAPFMEHEVVAGRTFYRLDTQEVQNNPEKFKDFLLQDYRFSVGGVSIEPKKPEFVLLDSSKIGDEFQAREPIFVNDFKAFILPKLELPYRPYISDTQVLIAFELPNIELDDEIKLELLSPSFALPEGKYFTTNVIDYRDGSASVLSFRGTTMPEVLLSGSSATSFWHFVKEGVYHILIGYDHVLFVLCLTIVARSLIALFWAVTGFTIGHSVALVGGALGYVPQADWFIPLVELLVAVSIIITALLILFKKHGAMGFWLAGSLGILHGFGFSFMLLDMIGGTSEALVVALAGFNIGVEIGQLIIVASMLFILMLTKKYSQKLNSSLRYGVALFALIAAIVMVVDRSQILKGII